LETLTAKIPFQFHVGNAKLPAGEYRIHLLDDSDLTVTEITSADGSTSALFQVQNTDANATPAKTELVFNKYGNRYFLGERYVKCRGYGLGGTGIPRAAHRAI